MFIDRVFVPAKPFQPSLVFASKIRVYPSEAPFRCSTLGEAPVALPTNIILWWKALPRSNTLAYY